MSCGGDLHKISTFEAKAFPFKFLNFSEQTKAGSKPKETRAYCKQEYI